MWKKVKCFFGFHVSKSTFSHDTWNKISTFNCKLCNKQYKRYGAI